MKFRILGNVYHTNELPPLARAFYGTDADADTSTPLPIPDVQARGVMLAYGFGGATKTTSADVILAIEAKMFLGYRSPYISYEERMMLYDCKWRATNCDIAAVLSDNVPGRMIYTFAIFGCIDPTTVLKLYAPDLKQDEIAIFTSLENLNVSNNRHVVDLSFCAKTLHTLWATGEECAVDNMTLDAAPNLTELDISNNVNVTYLGPSRERIERLYAAGASRLKQSELHGTISLSVLDVSGNGNITSLGCRVGEIQSLHASNSSGITDASLVHAKRITNLDASANRKITTVAPFCQTLTTIVANNDSGIDDDALSTAHALKSLTARNNPNITTIAPFSSTLMFLDASGTCGITDEELVDIRRDIRIISDCNTRIRNLC